MIDESEARQIISEIFGVTKLSHDQAAAVNFVLGFNNIWAKPLSRSKTEAVVRRLLSKPDTIDFFGGSWRFFAGWCSRLCGEDNYMDFYCHDHLSGNEKKWVKVLEAGLRGKGWFKYGEEETDERPTGFALGSGG